MALDALANLPFLLFILGALLAFFGRMIAIPVDANSWLGTLLVLLLGLKGGVGLAQTESLTIGGAAIIAGLLAAVIVPLLCHPVLHRLGGWPRELSAAAAGHYGSISVATFVAMMAYLESRGAQVDSVMIAVMALMEAPALLIGLMLASPQGADYRKTFKAALSNAPMLLLLGSMAIGWTVHSVQPDAADVQSILGWIPGLLSIYLLLLGQKAGLLLARERLPVGDLSFAMVWPFVSGTLAFGIGSLFGLEPTSLALLCILSASASYIVAPAVLSLAMPTLELTRIQVMVIGVTFPVNLLVGIPLWTWATGAAAG